MIAERRLAETRRPHAAAAPRLRAVPDRRHDRRLAPFLIVAALMVGALVFGVVALQALVAETSFRMQDLARRGVELRQDHGELRLEIAELSSPARIQKQAKRLGLHFAEGVRTLRVRLPEGGGGSAAAEPTRVGGSP